MPLIFPLLGTNTTQVQYTAGGFSTISVIGNFYKPSTFDLDSNNGLHEDFSVGGSSHKISEFTWDGSATYEMELIALTGISCSGTGGGTATIKAGIMSYNPDTVPSFNFNFESPRLDCFQQSAGVVDTGFPDAIGTKIIVGPLDSLADQFAGTGVSTPLRGFGLECLISSGNTSVTGTVSIKIKRIV